MFALSQNFIIKKTWFSDNSALISFAWKSLLHYESSESLEYSITVCTLLLDRHLLAK